MAKEVSPMSTESVLARGGERRGWRVGLTLVVLASTLPHAAATVNIAVSSTTAALAAAVLIRLPLARLRAGTSASVGGAGVTRRIRRPTNKLRRDPALLLAIVVVDVVTAVWTLVRDYSGVVALGMSSSLG